jgi:hypothetical protein
VTEYDARAFDAYEQAGWEAIAGRFAERCSPVTSQAIESLLDAALVGHAGFEAVAVEAVAAEIPVASADELIAALAEGTVRVGAALRAADDVQRDRLRESLEERLANWRRDDGFAVPAPMKLVSGGKPA